MTREQKLALHVLMSQDYSLECVECLVHDAELPEEYIAGIHKTLNDPNLWSMFKDELPEVPKA